MVASALPCQPADGLDDLTGQRVSRRGAHAPQRRSHQNRSNKSNETSQSMGTSVVLGVVFAAICGGRRTGRLGSLRKAEARRGGVGALPRHPDFPQAA